MTDTKAVKILSKFSDSELRRFVKFCNSPYFNSNKDVVKLFTYLKKFHPDFTSNNLKIESVFGKLYPGEKFNEGKIRNIISDLGALLEDFLATEFYRNDKFRMEFGLVKNLISRGEHVLSKKLSEKLLSENSNIDSLNKENFAEIIELLNLRLKGILASDSQKYLDTLNERNGLAVTNFLHNLFFTKQQELVDYHNYNLKYSTVSTLLFDSIDLDKFLNLLEEEGGEYCPVISMEIYLQKAFIGEDVDKNIEKFEIHFKKLFKTLNINYSANIMKAAQNIYVKKMNQYSRHEEELYYMKKLFNNYVFMEKEGMFEAPDVLLGSSFRMIAYTGSNLREFEWTLNFFDKYNKKLPEDYRNDMVNMCKGELYFNKGENQRALEFYSSVVKPNYYSLWHMKMTLCMIHFNLGNYETVLSISDAALVEIRRKYKGNETRNLNVEFFNFMKRLTNIKINREKSSLEKLRYDVLNANYYKFKPGKFLDIKLKELEEGTK